MDIYIFLLVLELFPRSSSNVWYWHQNWKIFTYFKKYRGKMTVPKRDYFFLHYAKYILIICVYVLFSTMYNVAQTLILHVLTIKISPLPPVLFPVHWIDFLDLTWISTTENIISIVFHFFFNWNIPCSAFNDIRTCYFFKKCWYVYLIYRRWFIAIFLQYYCNICVLILLI